MKTYEDFRRRAIQKASWQVCLEQKGARRQIDRTDVVQDLWVWLLSFGKDGKTGDDRMRLLLAPETRKFKRAVRELVAVGRRAWTHYEVEAPEGPQSVDKHGDPVSIFDLEDSAHVRWVSTSSYWPSPIERRVAELGPPDADILQMSAEGFNATEIADELDLSPALVRQRRKRALDRLRTELAEAA